MRRPASFPVLRSLGLAAFLAGPPVAALAQPANPLGVEWVGGGEKPRAPDGGEATAPTGTAPNPLGVEWVGGGTTTKTPSPTSGVRTDGGAATRPAPKPAAPNPLGVEWVGGTAGTKTPSPTSGVRTDGGAATRPTPKPAAPNPLGVEWVGGVAAPTTPPAPPPTTPPPSGGGAANGGVAPPAPPVPPVQPPPVQPPPAPPSPPGPVPTETGQQMLAAALIDTWLYRAVAFSGSGGTISETSGVSGTLTFQSDGAYDQALSIGGIANVIKGRYRISGDSIETTYMWRGESVTDIFDVHLDPAAKRLTLAGRGSPKAHYLLERAE